VTRRVESGGRTAWHLREQVEQFRNRLVLVGVVGDTDLADDDALALDHGGERLDLCLRDRPRLDA
jgi:hypothetical protein